MNPLNINFKSAHRLKTVPIAFAALTLSLSTVLPLLAPGSADAATMTNRNVVISSSEASQTGTDYQFNFTFPSTTAAQSIRFEFCTNPLGSCTKPTGMDINYTLTTLSATQTFSEATLFTEYTGADAGACDDHNNGTPANSTEYCVTRTDTDSETAAAKQITIQNVTNPSTEASFYVRISVYSDTAFATEVHSGTVAGAVVSQLTVTGRVQERLQFCVAAIGDGGATDTTLPSDVPTCIALSETTVDIGVIDSSSAASMAPVDNTTSLLGDDEYGIAMINTNAGTSTTLTFFAEDPTAVSGGDTHQLKSFRVVPTDCDAVSSTATDQCFQSAANGGAGTTITSGTEWFGMYVPCVDTTQGAVSTPMTVDADFNGFDNDTADDADCENDDKSDNGGLPNIGWNTSTTATDIASRSGVIDDAIVKLSFVGQAAATTPTGTYTVVTTYIATPSF